MRTGAGCSSTCFASAHRGDYGSETLAPCYLAEFLIKAVRNAQAPRQPAVLPTYFQDHASEDFVGRAIDFIQRNFARPLGLGEIAAASGMSQSHLGHLFKRKTGLPVMGYLQDCRIQHAKTLLLESGLNVSQIAVQAGYSSIHVFSRSFKKVVSVSPAQYAKMVRLALAPEGSGDQK